MAEDKFLQEFIQECSQAVGSETREKFVGWETILTVLVIEGLKMMLPELKEWVKLGATVITTKRLALQKRLEEYALEKELDFAKAEKAAAVIADNINEENVSRIIKELEVG